MNTPAVKIIYILLILCVAGSVLALPYENPFVSFPNRGKSNQTKQIPKFIIIQKLRHIAEFLKSIEILGERECYWTKCRKTKSKEFKCGMGFMDMKRDYRSCKNNEARFKCCRAEMLNYLFY